MQRICVLGGGGFLGSHLVQALLEQTELLVEAIDTDFSKLPAPPGARLRLTRASIGEPGLLGAAVTASDVVLSTTALCNPALYNTRPVEVIAANFAELVPLVELCAAQGKWLIHFSTCEVYGKGEPHHEGSSDEPMHEERSSLILGPVQKERWTYACAKQLLERLIWAHGKHDHLPFTIVRPFNVIGPRMDFITGVDGEGTPRVLACFMRSLLLGERLQLVNGGQQRRAFIYVGDFIDAILEILRRPQACQGEILNIGNPNNDITIATLAETMIQLYTERHAPGARFATEVTADEAFYGSGYDDTMVRVPDISKAQQLLSWQPSVSLAQMLPGIIDDYVARYQHRLAIVVGGNTDARPEECACDTE